MAGSTSFGDDDGGVMSDINVTPLVDVVLVLLIVFMITVPAVVATARIKLDLPESRHADKGTEAVQGPLRLYLRREENGTMGLYLDEQPISLLELEALAKNQSGPDSPPVSFSCDKGVPYGEVVRVIDELTRIGLHKLSLHTQHVDSPGQ